MKSKVIEENRLVKMEKDVEFIKKTQKSMDDKFDAFIDKLDRRFDDMNKNFAGKWLEKAFWTIFAFLGTLTVTFAAVFIK